MTIMYKVSQQEALNYLRTQNSDLLNRIQAADFKTYAALSIPNAEVPVAPLRNDLGELAMMVEAQGLGQALYDDQSDDDELTDALAEFGFTPPKS